MSEQAQMEGLVINSDGQATAAGSNGGIAQRLLSSGFRVNSLRTLDVLRKDEWIAFDNAVIEVARQNLVGIGDLISAGLTFPLNNALGTTRVEWEQVSHMEDAELTMDGITRSQADRPEYTLQSLPVPIAHKEFYINARVLNASRTRGEPLDTTMAEQASTLVSEQQERILFKGATLVGNGMSIYGYTTAPNRNTGTLSGDWSDSSTVSGTDIIDDTIAMIEDQKTDNQRGQFWMYVPTSFHNRLQEDYKPSTSSSETIMDRLMRIESIAAVRESQDLDDGASGEVILVRPNRMVVDLVEGFQNTLVQWETQGGMQTSFKVMSILVPRMKSDASGQSGIVHYSV